VFRLQSSLNNTGFSIGVKSTADEFSALKAPNGHQPKATRWVLAD
jgi:hypothetical protein